MFDLSIEKSFNVTNIAGIDEAGRGPLAGPVVAAAVMLPPEYLGYSSSIENFSSSNSAYPPYNLIDGINDSKKISPSKRERLFDEITSKYLYSVGIVEAAEIDEINILEATKKACKIANDGLIYKPEIVIIDGNMKFTEKNFVSIVKGDTKSHVIAAASIIAKVTRDRIMHNLHQDHPEYNWLSNSGYGTKEHMEAVKLYGLTPHHRISFCKFTTKTN